uniref:50S ribosomal protein L9 n=1 Tax=Ndongobacter massiliensis TaxID=1871025 RepID=UPI000931994C|nr:50S ribosomal protein L9 [Ndongobacter massiliensis]
MKVILLEDVKGMGNAGDLVNAKPGYFRNYLEKNRLAVEATPDAVKRWKEAKKRQAAQLAKEKEEAQALIGKLEQLKVKIPAKAGTAGRLFGSVTAQDIANALEKQEGLSLDKKKFELKENIRTLGEYTIDVRVYPEMVARLPIQVEEQQ